MSIRVLLASAVTWCVCCVGCGADAGGESGAGAGGALPTGGSAGFSANGGAAGTPISGAGGVPSSGSGGVTASGGVPAMGGFVAAGGTQTMATGGMQSTGGTSNTGGTVTATGGTAMTGGTTGSGGASGSAGAAGASSSGGTSSDDPCAGGMVGSASDAPGSKTPARGYGEIEFTISTKTHITSLETTLAVPAKPPASGTLFLWPGLEPLGNSDNYSPIGTGVLQPVLTWGGTCAPTAPNDYSSWWISGQYVNTLASSPGHTGCLGGPGMKVAVGDELHILMTLSGTKWTQVITDQQSGKMVSFDIDMGGQAQNWAIFDIEVPSGREPVSDVVYTSTVITLAAPDPTHCTPSTRGTNDWFSAPRASADGTKCCVAKMIQRGKGVAATGPNQ